MAADDFQNTPPDQGLPAGLDPSVHAGNRPASGARRATPGEVLSQSFQGAQNAGDFLGLDTEFTGSQDPNQGYADGSLDLVPPPTTYAPDPAGYVPEPAPLPASDPVQDFAQAPSAFEFGEDLGSDESGLGVAEEQGSSLKPMLVSALVVMLLGAGAVLYGPSLYSRYFGSEAEVARTDEPSTTVKTTRPKIDAPLEPAAKPSDAPAVAQPVAADPKPVAVLGTGEPVREPQSSATKATPKPPTTTVSEPSAIANPPTDVAAALPGLGGPSPRKVEFPDLGSSTYEWASEDRLELIWRGSEVPMEAVRAPAKTLMPRVGQVRVFTLGGDVFAGRLYAVGQGLVWLDGEVGRIGLDGSRVERIEVLPPDPTGAPVASGDALMGGRRVRVKVPGGMLYGSVLKAEGEDLMLALETGGRVRVKATDVQDLGSGRAVVVRR